MDVWQTANIQSPTAEIRRGKKKKQHENIMSASATQGGHNNNKKSILCGALLASLKAKFHYASWFEACSKQVRSWFKAGSKLVCDQLRTR